MTPHLAPHQEGVRCGPGDSHGDLQQGHGVSCFQWCPGGLQVSALGNWGMAGGCCFSPRSLLLTVFGILMSRQRERGASPGWCMVGGGEGSPGQA